jgi:Protein of unknown function (DUF2800)
MGDHAKLSPSSAHRWLLCPASAHQDVVSPDTDASLDGTAGHFCLAMELRNGTPVLPGTVTPEGRTVTAEMVELVKPTVEWVKTYREKHPQSSLVSEEKVQIGEVFGLASGVCYGTMDIGILATTEMVVLDYKSGWNEVSPENNPQLMLYAAGFDHEMGGLWDVIRLVISQPRNGGVKEHVISRADLHAWVEKNQGAVQDAALLAEKYVPGEHCDFCPAAGVCKALQQHSLALARQTFDSPTGLLERITVEELSEILSKEEMIKAALKAARSHAEKLIQLGTEVPGWKLVEGKKNRIWADEQKAQATFRSLGFNEEEFAPRKLVSPAQAEKLVGAAAVAPLATKPAGEPTLAPVSDKRPPYKLEMPREDGEMLKLLD